jgi:ubiquinone biosynthesis monooxygenase Coq7
MTGAVRPLSSSLTTTVARRAIGAKSAYPSSSSSSSSPASKRHLTTSTSAIPTDPPTPTPTPHTPPVFDWVALDEEKKIWSDFEDNDEAVLVQDLRSDHAGETGAVWIYAGAKAAMTFGSPDRYSPEARAFVSMHHATEAEHLAYFDRLLDMRMKSKLLPLWKISGWCLGFFPTLIGGEPALFLTVEAVETFVEEHYKVGREERRVVGGFAGVPTLIRGEGRNRRRKNGNEKAGAN